MNIIIYAKCFAIVEVTTFYRPLNSEQFFPKQTSQRLTIVLVSEYLSYTSMI